MSTQTANVLSEVEKLIKEKKFKLASTLLSKYSDSKDPNIIRAKYLLFSSSESSSYNEAKSKDCLDKLFAQSDTWGLTEKGRCLMYGELWVKDTYQAEDLLMRALQDDDGAKYYVAKIHGDGMHQDAGESVFDIQQALQLHKEVTKGNSYFVDFSKFEYAKLVMKESDPSMEDKLTAFEFLLDLNERKGRSKALQREYSLFLLDRLSEVFNLIFSREQQKGSMEEMLEVDTKRKHCLSALDLLKRNIS